MSAEQDKVAAEEAAAEENVTPVVEKPVARHVRQDERQKAVSIDWPIEFAGKVYDEIVIRRPLGIELAEYVGHLAAGDIDVHPPYIVSPAEVYALLDDDDMALIDEELEPFLSKRFLAVIASSQDQSNKS